MSFSIRIHTVLCGYKSFWLKDIQVIDIENALLPEPVKMFF